MTEINETPEELANRIVDEITRHRALLSLSEGRDIVVVLGNTGSGKSTTLNWLAGKELNIGDFDDIVLKNKSDYSAVAIGETGYPMTKYPFLINVSGLSFIDLPSFGYASGLSCDLINATFIKLILEKANRVKVMFIVSQDEIAAVKGELFKTLLTGVERMFDEERRVIIDSSLLVITKSTLDDGSKLGGYLLSSVPSQHHLFLSNWIVKRRLFQVKKPRGGVISYDGRREILSALGEINGQKITHVNIDALYPSCVNSKLKDIFTFLLERELYKFMIIPDKTNISSLQEAINYVKGDSRTADDYSDFWERFGRHLDCIDTINILKPLTEKVFKETLEFFRRIKTDYVKAQVIQWECHLKLLSIRP